MIPTAGQDSPPVLPNGEAGKQADGATHVAAAALSPERTLRRLFLTLFLRGRSSRGLQKDAAPKSVGSKLGLTLAFYALFGLFALFFRGQPVFALSVYLHGMTFVFLGMFIAASAGEVLFNKEEADILLHRPVTPSALLRAKVGVLVEVSLWLAGAFNLGGFIVGVGAKDGGWSFPFVHAASTSLEALFATGCVVLTYQVCLRWFGRERLEGLMTTTQVFVAIAAVLAGQLMPRMMGGVGGKMTLAASSWWVCLLPPAWLPGWTTLSREAEPAVRGRWPGGGWRPLRWSCGWRLEHWPAITGQGCNPSAKHLLGAQNDAPAGGGSTWPCLCRHCDGGCAIRYHGRPSCSPRLTWCATAIQSCGSIPAWRRCW